jgi:hypothetical protein
VGSSPRLDCRQGSESNPACSLTEYRCLLYRTKAAGCQCDV